MNNHLTASRAIMVNVLTPAKNAWKTGKNDGAEATKYARDAENPVSSGRTERGGHKGLRGRG